MVLPLYDTLLHTHSCALELAEIVWIIRHAEVVGCSSLMLPPCTNASNKTTSENRVLIITYIEHTTICTVNNINFIKFHIWSNTLTENLSSGGPSAHITRTKTLDDCQLHFCYSCTSTVEYEMTNICATVKMSCLTSAVKKLRHANSLLSFFLPVAGVVKSPM